MTYQETRQAVRAALAAGQDEAAAARAAIAAGASREDAIEATAWAIGDRWRTPFEAPPVEETTARRLEAWDRLERAVHQ